jgi:uncharacterized protein YbjT (DUF2867 family)
MKIVIIGGTGRIGSKACAILAMAGHQVVAAAPSMGIDAVTGEGLADALTGADMVVDAANSPSFADDAVMAFFRSATGNLIAAARAAGVGHYVALSVVGTDRLQDSGYFRAKSAQEEMIAASGLPYTILRATQFFEFMGAIAGPADGDTITLPTARMQPIVSDDVAAALASVVLAAPANAIREVAGPEAAPIADFVDRWLKAQGDPRRVIADPQALYYGMPLEDATLLPAAGARIMATRFDAWLAAQGGAK